MKRRVIGRKCKKSRFITTHATRRVALRDLAYLRSQWMEIRWDELVCWIHEPYPCEGYYPYALTRQDHGQLLCTWTTWCWTFGRYDPERETDIAWEMTSSTSAWLTIPAENLSIDSPNGNYMSEETFVSTHTCQDAERLYACQMPALVRTGVWQWGILLLPYEITTHCEIPQLFFETRDEDLWARVWEKWNNWNYHVTFWGCRRCGLVRVESTYQAYMVEVSDSCKSVLSRILYKTVTTV